MALYAIGDLHLSLGTDKSMEVFGGRWSDYVNKISAGFSKLEETDTCVLCGDTSWGMDIEEAGPDFQFIEGLPGNKILLKGNHDYWWSTVSKMQRFFEENNIKSISILNNNSFEYGDFSICGTRGWFYEEDRGTAHDKKIFRRELMRLEASLNSAGDRQKLVFLHYPPKYLGYECKELLEILEKHSVKMCCYGHIHDRGCAAAFEGELNGTEYTLVSADHLLFSPKKIL